MMIYTQKDVDNYFSVNDPIARYGEFEDIFDLLPEQLEPHLFDDGIPHDTNGSSVESATLLPDQSIEVVFYVFQRWVNEDELAYEERFYLIRGHLEGPVIMAEDGYGVEDGSVFVVDSFEIADDRYAQDDMGITHVIATGARL